jgi:hypothetical protein
MIKESFYWTIAFYKKLFNLRKTKSAKAIFTLVAVFTFPIDFVLDIIRRSRGFWK